MKIKGAGYFQHSSLRRVLIIINWKIQLEVERKLFDMILMNRIPEAEVIAEFLKAEFNSKRFGDSILNAIGSNDKSVITHPDLKDDKENLYRRSLLGEVRGFGQNRALFENFPSEVAWYNAIFSKDDLHRVMYINYSYWNQLSNNTRLPTHASKSILNEVQVYGVSNTGFKEIFNEIKRGTTFQKLIFVLCNEHSRIVVLEGHARLTAYFLDTDYLPNEMEVIIGYSEGFLNWNLY